MKKKLTLVIILNILSLYLFSENSLTIGSSNEFKDFSLTNLSIVKGLQGYDNLEISPREYKPSLSTDLLMHFNDISFTDYANNYIVTHYDNINSVEKVLGKGSAYFFKGQEIVLSSKKDSMFSPGRILGDFSIEFWVYPMTISEDTTMFSWKGVNKVGSDFIPQKIKCYFENRNFVWEFENFFIPEDFSLNSIKLKGKSKLIPNKWNHHLVRYDSQTGLLEYLMNGEAEDVVYTTPSGREESIIYPPYTGNFSKKSIYLGERFRGFIDELRISESFVSEPNISKFESYGSFKTAVYDLDGQDVVLNNITFKEVEKPETLIKYSYRFLTEPFLEHNLDIPWQTMNDIKNKDHGRYIQIKGELFSNGGTDISPRVESINIHWDLIPPPPTPNFKSITALPSSVKIEWSSVKHCNVEGYLLYYGRESDNYEEVIDVGKETSYTINSLVSNDIYYFSIRAYLDNQKSEFSNEIYCRAK